MGGTRKQSASTTEPCLLNTAPGNKPANNNWKLLLQKKRGDEKMTAHSQEWNPAPLLHKAQPV